ncbi:hypothetical protein Tco_0282300 [Tanacetum coccineum]
MDSPSLEVNFPNSQNRLVFTSCYVHNDSLVVAFQWLFGNLLCCVTCNQLFELLLVKGALLHMSQGIVGKRRNAMRISPGPSIGGTLFEPAANYNVMHLAYLWRKVLTGVDMMI